MKYARSVQLIAAGMLLLLPSDQGHSAMPAGWMFEQHVAELQDSIAKARQGNSEIEAENAGLREQIGMLEEELQETASVRETVPARPEREFNEDALEAKETALYEQRLANLLRRQARLKELNERKEKRLEYFEKDNSKAREDIDRLRDEVGRLQTSPDDKESKIKVKVARKDLSDPADAAKLRVLQKNLTALDKDVARERAAVARIADERDEIYRENTSLREALAAGQSELKKKKTKARLLDREVSAATSTSPLTAEQMTNEMTDLENYAEQLRQNLAGLKKVSAAIKSDSVKEERQLLAHRQGLQQQQALLKARMKVVSPASLSPQGYDDLVARKKDLVKQHERILEQIAAEERKSQGSPAASKAVSQGPDYAKELAQSQKRINDLQEKVDALRKGSSGDKVPASEALTAQLRDLEAKLEDLRNESKKPAAVQTPEEAARTKEAIKQLESQRSILQSSLRTINSKYRLNDLTVKGLGTPEGELKEYLDVLERENAALQEKLLILQMQQDKKF